MEAGRPKPLQLPSIPTPWGPLLFIHLGLWFFPQAQACWRQPTLLGAGGAGRGHPAGVTWWGAGSYWSPETLAGHVDGMVGTHLGGVGWEAQYSRGVFWGGGHSCCMSLLERLREPRRGWQCMVGVGTGRLLGS